MNNLQYLYMHNSDFQSFITNHLVVFEHWYERDLNGTDMDDDAEAHNWLMAEQGAVDSDEYDLEAMRAYARKVRDLLLEAYSLACLMWARVPACDVPSEWARRMNDLYEPMLELGIEV